MGQVFKVDSTDEAVKLANKFKQEGRYKYFRGHGDVNWKMHSTYFRANFSEQQRADYLKAMLRFINFCKRHYSLAYLASDEYVDHLVAIMQHYGVPTRYIDFTRDPAVAAFFATDCKNATNGQSACIICLSQDNIYTINSLFEHARLQDETLPADFIIEIDVCNLWRLQAQQGLFLFSPDPDIERHVSLDKIVFPLNGPVATPPREMIYPVRKSALEILLDSYFDNEQKLMSGPIFKEMFERLRENNPNVSYTQSNDPLGMMHKNLKPGAKPHASWTAAEMAKWESRKTELWTDVQSTYVFEISAAIFTDNPLVACTRLCVDLETEMEKGNLLREHLVNFTLDGELDFEPDVKQFLLHCMRVCWDGMRILPYTNEEIATSLSNLVLIFITAYHAGLKGRIYGAERTKQLYKDLLGEDDFTIEMAGRIRGDSSRAVVSRHYLSDAFRDDLTEVVAEELRQLMQSRYDNASRILLLVPDPALLFDFKKLRELFVKEIIPTQVYLRSNNEKNPIFFTPVQLSVLGLP